MEKTGASAAQFASARRRSKADIRLQTKRLTGKLELKPLIDAIPEVVLVLNANQQIVLANRTAAETFWLDGGDSAYGLRAGEMLDCVHASEGSGGCGASKSCEVCGVLSAALASLRGVEDVQECRILQRASGDALDLRVWAVPTMVEGERFVIFTMRDIGIEKRKAALDRVFFHDVMNTAGTLRGLTKLLVGAAPDEREQFLKTIRRLGDQLVEEIGAQRDLMAAEERMLSVSPVPLDSLDLLEAVVGFYQDRLAERPRDIRIDPEAAKVSLVSDLTLLTRVLRSMLKNALEASSPDGSVSLGCEADGEWVRFWVHNPGYVPPHVQLQVFQRSFSTRGNGRGLGTYSMKLLSERYLRGSVSFTSSEDAGTTFFGCYPLDLGT